jgi:hypothetical protein
MPAQAQQGLDVMRQTWRDLLFLHWEVDPLELSRRLPPGLSLDTFDGRAFIGLVPFSMRWLRFAPPLSLPLGFRVDEINVRTYVHRDGRDPGVWFFSLDAATLPAVVGARIGYKLPYFLSRFAIERQAGAAIRYRACRIGPGPKPAYCDILYNREGQALPAKPGTLEHFLIERYILYAFHRGGLYSACVHHTPYPVQQAHVLSLRETYIQAAGVAHGGDPLLAHFARSVEVRVLDPHRIA